MFYDSRHYFKELCQILPLVNITPDHHPLRLTLLREGLGAGALLPQAASQLVQLRLQLGL